MDQAEIRVLLRLQANLTTLRKSERKVAEYILSDPTQAIYQSITTLAENAQVSEASVIRLCKAVGYSGFQDLKINLAREIVGSGEQIHEDISADDDAAAIMQKVMSANIKAIEDTLNFVNPTEMQRAVDAIAKTHRLEFYGVGGSGMIAADAQHAFFKYVYGSCISYCDPHMQAMSAATMRPGDVAVGISHTGATKDIVDSLRIAKAAGATVIAITGGLKSPAANVCDIVLTVVAREQHFKPEPMSSRIAALSIIDALATSVAFTRPNEVLGTLDKTRAALADKRY
ncbi:MAG: MurR/RpiR family transcriptional regulator [Oscillospiraceae bacterium]|nr:MurR/RpiR family transcriptional regulator [Oscillospiraceae bacterium]